MPHPLAPDDDATARRILDALRERPGTRHTLAERLGLDDLEISITLCHLDLTGRVRQVGRTLAAHHIAPLWVAA